MSSSAEWMKTSYQESFEKEILGLKRRLMSDPSCSVQDLEGTLKNLYILEGSDWLGRGELQSITISATIAAYEMIIEEIKNSKNL